MEVPPHDPGSPGSEPLGEGGAAAVDGAGSGTPLPTTAPPPEPGPALPPAPAPPIRKSGAAFFLLVLALFALLGTMAQAASPVLGLAWSELCGLLLPAAVAAAGSNLVVRRALLLAGRPPARVLGLALLVGVFGFFTAGSIMALSSLVLPARWLEVFDMSKLFQRPPLERAALSVAAATLAPLCEEAAFRGWTFTALRTRHGTGVAIALSAVFFAVMHLDPVRFVALVALGALYAWLAWRSGSLWPAVLAHATNNALGVGLASTGVGQPGLAGPRPPWQQLAGAALFTLVVAGGLLRLAAAAFARATPAPPPVEAALVRRDPAQATRFDPGRVPRALALAAGVAVLALLVLVRAAR